MARVVVGDVPTLNENKITGLKFGKKYQFLFANVDEAGNVFYFSKSIKAKTKSCKKLVS